MFTTMQTINMIIRMVTDGHIFALCKSYLYITGKRATLEHIYYFTAYAYHLNDPGVIQRHRIKWLTPIQEVI